MKKNLFHITIIFILSVLFSCGGNESRTEGASQDSLNARVAATQDSTESSTHYVCPMHPDEKSDQPGSCSVCGMPLEAQS